MKTALDRPSYVTVRRWYMAAVKTQRKNLLLWVVPSLLNIYFSLSLFFPPLCSSISWISDTMAYFQTRGTIHENLFSLSVYIPLITTNRSFHIHEYYIRVRWNEVCREKEGIGFLRVWDSRWFFFSSYFSLSEFDSLISKWNSSRSRLTIRLRSDACGGYIVFPNTRMLILRRWKILVNRYKL